MQRESGMNRTFHAGVRAWEHPLLGPTVRSQHPGFPPYPMPEFESLAEAAEFDEEDVAAGAVVYYLERADGCVKIGRSIDLPARVRALRRHYSGLRIIATEPGSWGVEQYRHHEFWGVRAKADKGIAGGGEWFHPRGSFLDHLASMNAAVAA